MGVSVEATLDYLSIVAEEASRSDLVGHGRWFLLLVQSALSCSTNLVYFRINLNIAIREATTMVSQAVTSSLSQAGRHMSEKLAALKCFEAWLQHIPSR